MKAKKNEMACELGSTLLVQRYIFLKYSVESRTASDTRHAIHEQTHHAPSFQGQIHKV